MIAKAELSKLWAGRPYHRQWLLAQAEGLMDFFQYRAINPKAASMI